MIEIREAQAAEDVDAALAIAEMVWGAPPVSTPIARALSFAGWYVSLATHDGEPVGMCAGIVGVHGHDLHLHSHLAAVLPAAQGRGIGRALKRHQRAWCLDHGIETVTWTFDPLVRENARFNLHHLGAVGDRYLVDLYGEMDDEINRGHPSDRLLMRWDLLSPDAVLALDTPVPVVPADELRHGGAIDAIDAIDAIGRTVRSVPTDAGLRLVATPEAIVDLRRTDPDQAQAWRMAVREALTAAFADGLRPVAMTDEHSYFCCREAR